MPTPSSHIPASIAAALMSMALLAPSMTAAQQIDGEPDDDLDGEIVDNTEDEDEDDGESSSAFDTFDDMEVTRIAPDQVPDFRPGLPRGTDSRVATDDLPQMLTGEQLEQLSYRVASSTVEIVAVVVPPEPYRPTEMIYRGHAVWISPHTSGDDPKLIATADWLEDADRIYAAGKEIGDQLSRGGLTLGATEPQPIDDFTADRTEFLDRHRDDLVPLQIEEANRHVNLARLSGRDDTEIAAPSRGLILHDMETALPGSIFGFSPGVGNQAIPVGYRDSSELEQAFSFYFTVDFRAILGAPIVDPDGRLIGMTALRHPERPEETLAVPPGAIHAFLDTGRAGGVDPDDDDS